MIPNKLSRVGSATPTVSQKREVDILSLLVLVSKWISYTIHVKVRLLDS